MIMVVPNFIKKIMIWLSMKICIFTAFIRHIILEFLELYGKNLYTTLITHLFMFMVIHLFQKANGLFISMISIDSLINAFTFIKTLYENKNDVVKGYYMNKVFENDMITRNVKNFLLKSKKISDHLNFNNEGHIGTTKKYFFFAILQMLSYFSRLVFWFNFQILFDTVFLLLSLPVFTVIILSYDVFVEIFNKSLQCIKNIIVFIVSKITAKLLNTLSESCLDNSPKIDHNELIDFYDDIDTLIGSCLVLIRAIIIQSFIHYVKRTNNIFYKYTISIFHKLQIDWDSGVALPIDRINEKKVYLAEIITKRKWRELMTAKTINIFFELVYSNNNENYSTKIGILFRNIQINFLRFMTMWSIASISPFISIGIDAYFVFFDKRFHIQQHFLPYLFGSISLLVLRSYFIGTLLMVLSEIIIKPLIEYVDENNLLQRYFSGATNSYRTLLIIPFIYLFSYLPYLSIVAPLSVYLYEGDRIPDKGTIIFSVLCILSLISDYNLVHISFLFLIGVVIYNISENKRTIKDDYTELRLDVIDDYHNPFINKRANSKAAKCDKIIKINQCSKIDKSDVKKRQTPCKWLTGWIVE